MKIILFLGTVSISFLVFLSFRSKEEKWANVTGVAGFHFSREGLHQEFIKKRDRLDFFYLLNFLLSLHLKLTAIIYNK